MPCMVRRIGASAAAAQPQLTARPTGQKWSAASPCSPIVSRGRSDVFVALRGIFRAMQSATHNIAFAPSATEVAPHITTAVRRLLPTSIVLQPGNRRLGARSMRKTMASAAAANGAPDAVVQHWGLWSRKSLVLVENYIDRTYPPDPMMASLFDFLLPVSRAPYRFV